MFCDSLTEVVGGTHRRRRTQMNDALVVMLASFVDDSLDVSSFVLLVNSSLKGI